MDLFVLFSWIYWDPPRKAFSLPYFHHSIAWYGICFALGFLFAYILLQYLFIKTLPRYLPSSLKNDKNSFHGHTRRLLDALIWYVVLGTIIGSRLGHVLFYDWDYYRANPVAVFKIWEGGLASHGGTIGILFALGIYYVNQWKCLVRRPSFLSFVDLFCIPVPFSAGMIRIGNFINQEIVGTSTSVPWAVIFGHPYEAVDHLPRHPVQLYEAFAYFVIFGILIYQWKKIQDFPHSPGFWFGQLLIMVFGARFILEFWKESQGYLFEQSLFQTGQILSIPFILAGGVLLFIPRKQASTSSTQTPS